MHLDVQTLSIVTVFVMALLGGLFVFAGLQNRGFGAPMMWGAAYSAAAVGLALVALRGTAPNWLSINIANVLVFVGVGLIWAGARMFDDRPVHAAVVVAPAAIWLVAYAVPTFDTNINVRIVLSSVLLSVQAMVIAGEFWRGRAEPLMSRWPTVCVLLAYAALNLARIPLTLLTPALNGQPLMSTVSFTLVSFGTLLFTVILAFLLLNMTKERTELQHKIASMVDPLCGVANRRAFLEGADRLLVQPSLEFEPLAVLLFDLDRFKVINDRLGHGAGDTVLKIFAATASRTLGAGAVFGRIGGEEFAALLPVGDLGEAVAIADRVRREFVLAAVALGADDLQPSVSVGVCMVYDSERSVGELLAAADQALYRAKANGRNRVEAADSAAAPPLAPVAAGTKDRRRWPRAAANA